MKTTLYLLPALLAPLALANACTHVEVYYTGGDSSRPLAEFQGAFSENEKAYEKWAEDNSVSCDGWCQDIYKEGPHYKMRCVAPRISKTAGDLPAGTSGLTWGEFARRCNVNCRRNNRPGVRQGCGFAYGHC